MSPIRRPRSRQSLTPRRSCTVLPLLAKRLILSFSLQNRSLREESRQEAVKGETQTAPDAEMGWSRRRHASRQGSDGVRHIYTTTTKVLNFGTFQTFTFSSLFLFLAVSTPTAPKYFLPMTSS